MISFAIVIVIVCQIFVSVICHYCSAMLFSSCATEVLFALVCVCRLCLCGASIVSVPDVTLMPIIAQYTIQDNSLPLLA